ncbi:shikimate dehydrogenase [Paremcibacter congregatus]|uniref:shikimate dehydrogenase n=1 Tax=Paremcibacter congregatus TaxID=2043170 RepID=UPI003A9532BB
MTQHESKHMQAGVVGWPIGHSLSPRLHGYWLREHGIDGDYQAYAVKPENLKDFIRSLPAQGICGVNLTVPHKELVFPFLDYIDDLARKIGAVNFVRVEDDKLYGGNTDGYGFLANLQENAPTWRPTAGPVAIIGAGGAARAAIVSLLEAGVPEVRLYNRTKTRAEKLGQIYAEYYDPARLKVGDWVDLSSGLSDITLLVNTTTLGMKGQPPLEIDLSRLPNTAVVYDIVYNPLETDLLRAARERGNVTVDGLGMLLYQAAPAFAAWFGQKVKVDPAVRHYVLKGLEV